MGNIRKAIVQIRKAMDENDVEKIHIHLASALQHLRTEKGSVSDMLVFDQMASDNGDIACSTTVLNLQRRPKNGGGVIEIGVASPHFDHLINGAGTGHHTHHCLLYTVNMDQYEKAHAKLLNAIENPTHYADAGE